MEADFELLSWRQPAGEQVLKRTRCPKDIAEAFLETDSAIELLPGIRLLVGSPIVTQQDDKLVVLNKGYHRLDGGIYVEHRVNIQEVSLDEARQALLNLLIDFDFTTRSDRSSESNGALALSAIIGGTKSGNVFFGMLTEVSRQEFLCSVN
jgi:hypothetical protein